MMNYVNKGFNGEQVFADLVGSLSQLNLPTLGYVLVKGIKQTVGKQKSDFLLSTNEGVFGVSVKCIDGQPPTICSNTPDRNLKKMQEKFNINTSQIRQLLHEGFNGYVTELTELEQSHLVDYISWFIFKGSATRIDKFGHTPLFMAIVEGKEIEWHYCQHVLSNIWERLFVESRHYKTQAGIEQSITIRLL